MTSALVWIALLTAMEGRQADTTSGARDGLPGIEIAAGGEPPAAPLADPTSAQLYDMDAAAELQAALLGDWTMASDESSFDVAFDDQAALLGDWTMTQA